MRLTLLLALLLTLTVWCDPWLNWYEPFSVDDIRLGDEEREVCNRLGSPPRVRLVGRERKTLWIYPDRSVLFDGWKACGVAGLELKQATRVVARAHEANEEFIHQVGAVQPEFSGYRYFPCDRQAWSYFVPVPAEKFMMRARYEKGHPVSFEIENKESYQPLDLPDAPSIQKPLPHEGGVRVEFGTTAGSIEMELYPEVDPKEVARVISMVKSGFYDDTPLFQVLPKCQVVFGVNSRPLFQVEQDYRFGNGPWSQNSYRLEAGTLAVKGPTYIQINLKELPDGVYPPVVGRITKGLENLMRLAPLNVVSGDLRLDRYWENSGAQVEPRIRSTRVLP